MSGESPCISSPLPRSLRLDGAPSPPPRLPRFYGCTVSLYPPTFPSSASASFEQNRNAGAANAGAFPEYAIFFRSPSRQDGDLFCLLRLRCAGSPGLTTAFSAPNQVGIWIFSVKDYCFSKPLITGIVRFVQAKQRAKTPTRFRAGGSCRHFREFRLTFVQTAHIFRLDFVHSRITLTPLCADTRKFTT